MHLRSAEHVVPAPHDIPPPQSVSVGAIQPPLGLQTEPALQY
jgi:hypothetical protein